MKIEEEVEEIETAERELIIEVGEHLTETPHKTRILWGSRPDDDAPVCEYRFATKEELAAFEEGTMAANGWMDYAVWDDDQEVGTLQQTATGPQ
jgi:hypothetical protein